jgi:ATP/maltotriose-dependent transcriptional regulator MalT
MITLPPDSMLTGFLNIAVTTAKTHLKNIFSKTGVTRQAELMLLAAHISSPGRSAS